MFRSRSRRGELRGAKPFKCAATVEYQHSNNNSRDSGISGLCRPLACREALNDFGDDADQFVTRRRDSTGAELPTKPLLSRSSSLSCIEPAVFGDALSPSRLQSNHCGRLQTYYPLHQGPTITVTSADGTTLCGDSESDNQRNAAAQSLFRALTRQDTMNKLNTLDCHMEKILGAVGLELEIKSVKALNELKFSDNEWDIQSMHAVFESGDENKGRKWTRRIKDTLMGWAAKVID